MAYNSYFPQTYTNSPYVFSAGATPTQTWTAPTSAQPQINGINWVQGEAGAKAVPVQPGQKALLMDSETNVFYVKSSDVSGGRAMDGNSYGYRDNRVYDGGRSYASGMYYDPRYDQGWSMRGGMSYTGSSKSEMVEELKQMMNETTDATVKNAIQDAIAKMNK